MSKRIWKDVLYPGTLHVPTGDPSQPVRVVTFTQDELNNVVRVNRQKVAEGWNVPACWEHQDVWPVHLSQWDRLAQQTKNVFAPVVDYRLSKTGAVEACIEVDDSDIPTLKRVKYVSPRVSWDWRDSTGRTWPGMTITHVAATPRPVQHKQRAFDLSQSSSGYAHIHLSADYYQNLKLSEGGMDEELETIDTPTEGEGGDSGKLSEAISVLESLGLHLGDGTTMDNLCERLVAAAKTKAAHTGELDEEEELEEPEMEDVSNDMPEDVGPSTQPPPVTLSLQKQQALAAKLAKTNIQARIERLRKSGRVTPHIADSLATSLQSVTLSFGDDGELVSNSLLSKVEAYEALPAGVASMKRVAAKPKGNVKLSLNGRPDDGRQLTDEEALALFDKT